MEPVTVKMDAATRSLAERAAEQRGMKLGEYVRIATREAATRDLCVCVECGRKRPRKKAA